MGRALAVNTTLTDLSFNDEPQITGTGWPDVMKGLAVNSSVQRLEFRRCGWDSNFGDVGATGLGRALAVNTTLTCLSCYELREITDAGWPDVMKALTINTTLQRLDLQWSRIGDAGVTALAQALTINTTLTSLDLSHCEGVSTAGASKVMQALAVNTTLNTLDLAGWGQIDRAVALEITKSLTANVALTSLFIRLCRGFDDTFAPDMIKMLGVNTSLTYLGHEIWKYQDPGIKNQTHLSRITAALSRNKAKAAVAARAEVGLPPDASDEQLARAKAKRKAEEEAKRKAEEEAKRKAEEEAKRKRMQQAPGGVFAYDDRAARALIVGVETKLALKPGFVPGLPSTKFEASSAAGLGAESLMDQLHKASTVQLPQAVTALMALYREGEALVSNLKSSTDKMRQLQEASAKLLPLSSQLGSQSLATLEKELAALKSAEKSAAEAAKYREAENLMAQHAQKTQEVSEYKKFKSEFLDPLRTCSADMVRDSQNLSNLFSRVDAARKTIEARSKELNDASGALKQGLETASSLTDHVLAWLQTRELGNLKSTLGCKPGDRAENGGMDKIILRVVAAR